MPKIIAPGPGKLYHGVFPGGSGGLSADASEANLDEYERAAGRKVAQARKDFLKSIETCAMLYIPQMRNSKNAISRHLGSANYPHDRRKMDAS